jgi:succinate dehydrogenase/fumarate reductase flavoprotein subunit
MKSQDREVDVIVIGGGVGGCAAALEASLAGADVLLLEAGDAVGGNAARSTGYLAFAGTKMQRDAGIEDSPADFVRDMLAEIDRQRDRYGIVFDEELAWRFAEESATTYEFLVELGVEFTRFIPRPAQHSIDRMVGTKDVSEFGTAFARALDAQGVRVLVHTRGRSLIREGERIVGVHAEGPEGPIALRARNAVILSAGGYQANAEMRRRYQPARLADTPYLGVHTDRGDGHAMGAAVGGDLINMTMVPSLIMVASAFVEDAIAIDRTGQRFHDEAGPYDARVDALESRPERIAHYIFDARTMAEKRLLIDQMPQPAVSAPTLAELGKLIGCDPGQLELTVEEWNRAVKDGKDVRHGRVVMPRSGVGITEAPYSAIPMVVGINFPAGGFRVTTDLEVIDVFGRTIPGLLAVGDCVGGVSPAIGLGGLKITPAVTFGRIAGRVAAGPLRDGRDVGDAVADGKVTRVTDTRQRIAVVDLSDGSGDSDDD